ncbi:MAG: Rab family GTPase [Promethearchaeota archaeon]
MEKSTDNDWNESDAQIPVMKVFFAGEGGVGKTTFVERFVTGMFNPSMIMTIGVNHAVKTMKTSDGRNVTLQVWDLGGEERFRFVVQNYVKGSNAGAVCFDLTRMSTYLNLDEWLGIIREILPDIPLYLLGMKRDLAEGDVDVDNYQDLIDKYHLERLILTSSVTGEGVDETFQSMADQLPTEPEFFRSV